MNSAGYSKLVRPRRATAADISALGQVVASAFAPLTVSRWLVPDEDTRRQILPSYFAEMIADAIHGGWVDTVTDRCAVAVWKPAGEPDQADTLGDAWLHRLCGSHVDRFVALHEAMEQAHPTEPRHDHLMLLAVHPDRQGSGLGGALLRHRHRLLDEYRRPAYLEASSMRSRGYYTHFGYRPIGTPFAPPGCWAPLYPMWREPTDQPTRLAVLGRAHGGQRT